jgi:hypothetical protein
MPHRNKFFASPIADRATRSQAQIRAEAAPNIRGDESRRPGSRARASGSLPGVDIDEQIRAFFAQDLS